MTVLSIFTETSRVGKNVRNKNKTSYHNNNYHCFSPTLWAPFHVITMDSKVSVMYSRPFRDLVEYHDQLVA